METTVYDCLGFLVRPNSPGAEDSALTFVVQKKIEPNGYEGDPKKLNIPWDSLICNPVQFTFYPGPDTIHPNFKYLTDWFLNCSKVSLTVITKEEAIISATLQGS